MSIYRFNKSKPKNKSCINIPYTYYLYHKPTGKKYYGVRVANWLPPEEVLWNVYFSSSERVHKLIGDYGKDSFDVEIRKIFDNSITASLWELRVLTKLNIKNKKDIWLNRSIGRAMIMDEEIKDKIRQKQLGIKPTKTAKRKMKHSRLENCPVYRIVSPENIEHVTKDLSAFCDTYSLNKVSLNKVANGRQFDHKGWKCVIIGKEYLLDKINEEVSKSNRVGSHVKWCITSPDKETFMVSNLKEFCESHGIVSSALNQVCKGKHYHSKGWSGYIIGKEYLRDKIVKSNKLKNVIYVIKNNDTDDFYVFTDKKDALSSKIVSLGEFEKIIYNGKTIKRGIKGLKIIGTIDCIKTEKIINT